jgi:ADP-ribose pyrophosphatase YjhB (NUDIX family)
MITIKNICLNCKKYGHFLNKCSEPITSYGIVCFNINNNLNITNKKIEKFFFNKFLDMSEYNYYNLGNITMIPKYYDYIKIILIRRKNSLNYIEFIRGKYDINNIEEIGKIFKLMSRDENIKIYNNDFDTLWNELWLENSNNKKFIKEYKISKNKFIKLKNNNFFGLLEESELSKYSEPEWEFPKGRKNLNENNIDCAIREFTEETNINSNELHILERLNHLEEKFKGTNNVDYNNIFYLASTDNIINLTNINSYEVGDIRWCSIPEALLLMRPYSNMKIKLIHQIYFFIINLINDISNNITNNITNNIIENIDKNVL